MLPAEKYITYRTYHQKSKREQIAVSAIENVCLVTNIPDIAAKKPIHPFVRIFLFIMTLIP